MNPIRKSFTDDPLFPFDYVFKDRKSPQRELPDHFHDRYELIYVYGGKGTQFIDQNFYEMNEGDLYVIPGNTIHRAFPTPDNPVTSSAVYFAPALLSLESLDDHYNCMRLFDLALKRKDYKIVTTGQLKSNSEYFLEEIHHEFQAKKTGYRHAIRLHLQQWLLQLNRLDYVDRQSGAPNEATIGPRWMRESLHFIAHHLDSDLGLSALSKQVSVTPAHFSRVFKQLTGMTVTDYVNAKRIALAKQLLLETDEGIDWIAGRCRFDSLTHFHRIFKKMTGQTPGAYKRGQRKA